MDPAAVEQAKLQEPRVDNIVAVGDIIHIKQSRPVNFQQQVSPVMSYSIQIHGETNVKVLSSVIPRIKH